MNENFKFVFTSSPSLFRLDKSRTFMIFFIIFDSKLLQMYAKINKKYANILIQFTWLF